MQELEEASKRGILIVNCTQCGHGSVSAIYETGQMTEGAGVIPGWDMTPEAALTKLSYVLGRSDWDLEKKREMIQSSLKGELTKCTKKSYNAHSSSRDLIVDYGEALEGPDMINRVVRMIASSLGMSQPDEVGEIQRVIGGSLSCALVAQFSDANYSSKNLEILFGNSVRRPPLQYANFQLARLIYYKAIFEPCLLFF